MRVSQNKVVFLNDLSGKRCFLRSAWMFALGVCYLPMEQLQYVIIFRKTGMEVMGRCTRAYKWRVDVGWPVQGAF